MIFCSSFIVSPYFRKPCWPQTWNQQQKQKERGHHKTKSPHLFSCSSHHFICNQRLKAEAAKLFLYAFQALCQWEIRENRDPIIHYSPRDWLVQVDAISSSCMLPLKRYPHSHMISCSANPIQYQKELSHTDSFRSLLFPPLLSSDLSLSDRCLETQLGRRSPYCEESVRVRKHWWRCSQRDTPRLSIIVSKYRS